jgi:hypothetical protein
LSVKALIKRVESDGYAVAAFVSQQVFETDAWVFLKFARDDLLERSDRGNVNALSNAKRAVENRVDTLLYAYGLRGYAESQRWGYPAKSEKLRLAGLFIPDAIYNMITSSRNELEHEYKVPHSGIDVANKVDVAQMFLGISDAEISRGFFRWIVGPGSLLDRPDAASWKVHLLPPQAFGLSIDRQTRLLRFIENGKEERMGFAEIGTSDMAGLFRVLRAALVPGRTQIVGPMTEATFQASFLQ